MFEDATLASFQPSRDVVIFEWNNKYVKLLTNCPAYNKHYMMHIMSIIVIYNYQVPMLDHEVLYNSYFILVSFAH